MGDERALLIEGIKAHASKEPRTTQALIGPSEIGTDCDRCLAHKLVGTPHNGWVSWLPIIGTAVHVWLAGMLLTELDGWVSERKVAVGVIGNRLIWGSCDAFHVERGLVVDFKIVGANTLKAAKVKPRGQYRVQGHLYGRGWELAGYDVNDVAILHLPRNSPALADSVWWSEPYDRDLALAAIARANLLWRRCRDEGAENVIPTLPRAEACYDCVRYPSLPGEQSLSALPKTGDPWAGILPPGQGVLP